MKKRDKILPPRPVEEKEKMPERQVQQLRKSSPTNRRGNTSTKDKNKVKTAHSISQASTQTMGNRKGNNSKINSSPPESKMGKSQNTRNKTTTTTHPTRDLPTDPQYDTNSIMTYDSTTSDNDAYYRKPSKRATTRKTKNASIRKSKNNNNNKQKCRGNSKYDHDRSLSKFPNHKKSLATLHHYESMVEAEIEETAIDLAIDSAILDLTGLHMDCSIIKKMPFVRRWIRGDDEKLLTAFPSLDCAIRNLQQNKDYDDDNDEQEEDGELASIVDMGCTAMATAMMTRERENENKLSSAMAQERETWMLFHLDIMDAQIKSKAPLRMTSKVIEKVRALPQKDIALYIRLDEEIPADSCTVYQVDMLRFKEGKRDKLFRYSKICSQKNVSDRIDCIVGTLASACLHQYSMSADDHPDNGTSSPFRPKRVFLDDLWDVASPKLQKQLANMAIPPCQVVDPLLREIHDESDLDFFYFDADLSLPEINNTAERDDSNTVKESSPRKEEDHEQEERDNKNSGGEFDLDDDWELRDISFEDDEEEYVSGLVVSKGTRTCGGKEIGVPIGCLDI